MKFFSLALVLFISLESHAGCGTILLRTGRVIEFLRGNEFMQEGVVIERQLLALDHTTSAILAYEWAARETRHLTNFGPGVEYLGPSPDEVAFVLAVPEFSLLTNAELRALVAIDRLLRELRDYGDGELVNQQIEVANITQRDLGLWERRFPARVIPTTLRERLEPAD